MTAPLTPFDLALRAALAVAPVLPCAECRRPMHRPHPACRAYARVVEVLWRVRGRVTRGGVRVRAESEKAVRERFPTLRAIQAAYGRVLVDMWKAGA